MIGLGAGALKVFVALEPQDMRKGFQGLSELALGHLGEELARDALFVFTNRPRDRLSFTIPIWYRGHRIPVASPARTTAAGGPAEGAERDRGG